MWVPAKGRPTQCEAVQKIMSTHKVLRAWRGICIDGWEGLPAEEWMFSMPPCYEMACKLAHMAPACSSYDSVMTACLNTLTKQESLI